MAFRFSLQSVLRLRKSMEKQEEKKLLAISLAANRVRSEIERLDEMRLMERRAANEDLSRGGMVGAMLQFHATSDERRGQLRREKTKQLAELEQKRKEQTGRYRAARQKREILEGLLERQETECKRVAAQRAQQSMDEMFLIRNGRQEEE